MKHYEMSLQDLHDNRDLPDLVEVFYCDDWHELQYLSETWINDGKLMRAEGTLFVQLGDNDMYQMPADKMFVVRYEDDSYIVDDTIEDNYYMWDETRLGYFLMDVRKIGDFLRFNIYMKIAGLEYMYLESFDTKNDPEMSVLYCLSSRKWNEEAVSEFWEILAVVDSRRVGICQQ